VYNQQKGREQESYGAGCDSPVLLDVSNCGARFVSPDAGRDGESEGCCDPVMRNDPKDHEPGHAAEYQACQASVHLRGGWALRSESGAPWQGFGARLRTDGSLPPITPEDQRHKTGHVNQDAYNKQACAGRNTQ